MRLNPFTLTALCATLALSLDASAACTAGNPNANVAESTPTSAFTDHGNGTVTHTLTGLMWKKCAQGLSGTACATGSATPQNWSAALASAVADTTGGYTDWRLPNKKELESIVEHCGYSPAINQTIFPATPASDFWSGSSYVPVPADAWYVYFVGGYTFANSKAAAYYARLVRGGQSFDSFDAQGDVTPDAFSFTAQTGVALSTLTASNPITISGITAPTGISITGGEYSINSGAYTAVAGTVNNGQTVTVRQTSSGSNSTLTTATLTVGGVSGAFNVTTVAAGAGASPPVPVWMMPGQMGINGTQESDDASGSGGFAGVRNPVRITFRFPFPDCNQGELHLALYSPAISLPWSYLDAALQWRPLPGDLTQITPFNPAFSNTTSGASSELFYGDLPLGDYELYLVCDDRNGHLDLKNAVTLGGPFLHRRFRVW